MCSEAKISWPLFEQTWFHSLWWTRFIILLFCISLLCSYFYILKTVRGEGTVKNMGAGLSFLDDNATSSEGSIIHWGPAIVNDSSGRSNSVLGIDVTPGQSHLRLLTQLAAILADVRLKRVTSRSPHLVPSINTVSWFTNPLIPIRDVLISAYKWTQCWVLEPCPLTWRVKEVVMRSKGKSRGDVCH